MAITNDPFEEFEFRPINEGLGFHKRQKSQINSNQSTKMTAAGTFSTKPEPISNSTTQFSTPLPRPEIRPDISGRKNFEIPTIEDDSISKAQTAVNEILKNLNQKKQLDFISDSRSQKAIYRKSKPVFFAAILDGMLISAGFLLSMIIMLTITKVDLFLNLTHPETSKYVYLGTIGLFASVAFIYMVINRTFTGSTPGEWAFDQRCGSEEEMNRMSFIPRIVLRTLIVMATGFITLPLLSYLFNTDVAGQMSDITLYKKSNA